MKIRWLIPLGFIAVALFAQSVDTPSGITIFSTSTLTNIFAASSTVDLNSYDSVSIVATVPTAQANAVGKIKAQWSNDSTSWVDNGVIFTNVLSATDMQYDLYGKLVTLQMTNAALGYVDMFPRQARYFRLQVKSTNFFTTATINITAQKMNNGGKP
jgi:hypothetical protein